MSAEPQKCSFFSLHHSSGLRKNSVAKGEKSWVTPAPSTQLPKKHNKMQLWPQPACVVTVFGGAISLTSRMATKQHFPSFLRQQWNIRKTMLFINQDIQQGRKRLDMQKQEVSLASLPTSRLPTPPPHGQDLLIASYESDIAKNLWTSIFSFNPHNRPLISHNYQMRELRLEPRLQSLHSQILCSNLVVLQFKQTSESPGAIVKL